VCREKAAQYTNGGLEHRYVDVKIKRWIVVVDEANSSAELGVVPKNH
jgi:hypothetical protein